MDALNKIVSSISNAFDFNQSTLSGCVDIIVVQQPDGSLKSTPFHVRFGLFKVIKSREQTVKILINNRPTGITMKLGEAGEGFFEEEPGYQINSSILSKGYDIGQAPQAGDLGSFRYQSPLLLPDEQRDSVKSDKGKMTLAMDNGNGKTSAETKYHNTQISEVLSEEMFTKEGKKKSLRPTSGMLKGMKLQLGMNTITYSVETSLQGSQTVNGHIILWPCDAKIVISDVDGTITKSDVMGHVMAAFKQDWSQPGIAPLYANIKRNGYHMLYLTSRAIGQSQQTKDFIYSIDQDGKKMPEGPVVMSPDQLIPSVKREIVLRRPEKFKMATLKDIKKLFPANYNPFYAGFGNRDTDAIAYRSVGIPMESIYIVNPKGDVDQYHHNDTKSYSLINSSLKETFPLVVDFAGHLPHGTPDIFSFREENRNKVADNTGKLKAY